MNVLIHSRQIIGKTAAAGADARPNRHGAAYAIALVVGGSAWLIASLALTGGFEYWSQSGEAETHLVLTLLCLIFAVWHALRLRGPLEYKMAQALLGTSVIFGVYAFAILAGRLAFSRPLLMSTTLEAVVMAEAVVLLRHSLRPPRVAIISPLTQLAGLSVQATLITDPATDLRGFDVLLVSLTGTVSSDWAAALSRAMLSGCKIRHIGEYIEERRGAVSLEHFDYDHLTVNGITSYRPFKRALDIALVVFLLPFAIPAVLFGMAAVLISSGRPIFFVQDRIGLGAGRFRMWKLRTMKPQAPGAPLQPTVPGDPRVTRVGWLLRRFRLDELPQLWNVLKGDMSVIGPRPEAVSLHEEYQSKLPNYAYRYLVRPGITGWAQVSTTPSATAEEAQRKLTFDLFYVKKVSLFLDLQILLRTLWTVTCGSGAR